MIRFNSTGIRTLHPYRRLYSTESDAYKLMIHNARESVSSTLEKQDKSSYILAQYIPEPVRDTFLAIRSFNSEIGRINEGGSNAQSRSFRAASQLSSKAGVSTADIKFKFWSDQLSAIFSDPYAEKNIGEPICILLRDALRKNYNLDISYFHSILQTRRHFLKAKSFSSVLDMCSYGEGTYSQLNYLTQGLLMSRSISPSAIELLESSAELQSTITDIAAHIGQATAISTLLLGTTFYARSFNQVVLPIDVMTKFDLSQESVLRLFQGHKDAEEEIQKIKEKMKNCVFETAVAANDHLISARSKFETARTQIQDTIKANPSNELLTTKSRRWRKGVPDAIFIPFMSSIPPTLYLQKLERYDFDILHPKLQQKEWRLAWRSFVNYYMRRI